MANISKQITSRPSAQRVTLNSGPLPSAVDNRSLLFPYTAPRWLQLILLAVAFAIVASGLSYIHAAGIDTNFDRHRADPTLRLVHASAAIIYLMVFFVSLTRSDPDGYDDKTLFDKQNGRDCTLACVSLLCVHSALVALIGYPIGLPGNLMEDYIVNSGRFRLRYSVSTLLKWHASLVLVARHLCLSMRSFPNRYKYSNERIVSLSIVCFGICLTLETFITYFSAPFISPLFIALMSTIGVAGMILVMLLIYRLKCTMFNAQSAHSRNLTKALIFYVSIVFIVWAIPYVLIGKDGAIAATLCGFIIDSLGYMLPGLIQWTMSYEKRQNEVEKYTNMVRFVRWLGHEVRVPANNCLLCLQEGRDVIKEMLATKLSTKSLARFGNSSYDTVFRSNTFDSDKCSANFDITSCNGCDSKNESLIPCYRSSDELDNIHTRNPTQSHTPTRTHTPTQSHNSTQSHIPSRTQTPTQSHIPTQSHTPTSTHDETTIEVIPTEALQPNFKQSTIPLSASPRFSGHNFRQNSLGMVLGDNDTQSHHTDTSLSKGYYGIAKRLHTNKTNTRLNGTRIGKIVNTKTITDIPPSLSQQICDVDALVESACKSVSQMREVLDEAIDLAHIHSSDYNPCPSTFDVVDLFYDTMSSFVASYAAQRSDFQFTVLGLDPSVRHDALLRLACGSAEQTLLSQLDTTCGHSGPFERTQEGHRTISHRTSVDVASSPSTPSSVASSGASIHNHFEYNPLTSLPTKSIMVTGVKERLRQVMRNFASNALKYGGDRVRAFMFVQPIGIRDEFTVKIQNTTNSLINSLTGQQRSNRVSQQTSATYKNPTYRQPRATNQNKSHSSIQHHSWFHHTKTNDRHSHNSTQTKMRVQRQDLDLISGPNKDTPKRLASSELKPHHVDTTKEYAGALASTLEKAGPREMSFTEVSKLPHLSIMSVADIPEATSYEISFFVQDFGLGFSLEQAQKLFKPFSQLRTGLQGSGLGLSLCKAAILRHDGHVFAFSPGETLGSSFWFTIPLQHSESDYQLSNAEDSNNSPGTASHSSVPIGTNDVGTKDTVHSNGWSEVSGVSSVSAVNTVEHTRFTTEPVKFTNEQTRLTTEGQSKLVNEQTKLPNEQTKQTNTSSNILPSSWTSPSSAIAPSGTSLQSKPHVCVTHAVSNEDTLPRCSSHYSHPYSNSHLYSHNNAIFHTMSAPSGSPEIPFMATMSATRSVGRESNRAAVTTFSVPGTLNPDTELHDSIKDLHNLSRDVGFSQKNETNILANVMSTPSVHSEIQSPTGYRILVVDDVSLTNRLMSRILKKIPHVVHVDTAENGLQALDLIREKGLTFYTHIFTDAQMPEMNGYELATRLREDGYQEQGGTLIGVTGNAMAEDITYFLETGAHRVLTKPVDRERLAMSLDPNFESFTQSIRIPQD